MRKEKRLKECAACPQRAPRLLAENAPIWQLWLAVRTQWRTGFCGAVGLDYAALYLVANTLGITITPSGLNAIAKLEAETLAITHSEGSHV